GWSRGLLSASRPPVVGPAGPTTGDTIASSEARPHTDNRTDPTVVMSVGDSVSAAPTTPHPIAPPRAPPPPPTGVGRLVHLFDAQLGPPPQDPRARVTPGARNVTTQATSRAKRRSRSASGSEHIPVWTSEG